jgi:hypothetical protein
MGMGLEPATQTYGQRLAVELGVAVEHAHSQLRAWSDDRDSIGGPSDTRLARAAVSKELARRGWS